MAAKLSKNNQSVEKILQVIEVMADNPEPMRLQDIAHLTGMPSSTALRMVNTLLSRGYANQDALSLRYSLSLKFAQIGAQVSSQFSIRNLAHPLMLELSRACRESCCLAIEQEMQAVYIDVIDGPESMLKIMQHIGKNAPLHCTGVGKLLLLNYDNRRLDEFCNQTGLPAYTPNTLTDRNALAAELAKIRSNGYAIDDEECELGARCIASGIRDYSGRIVAAISVSGPASRMTPERMAYVRPLVMSTASEISHLMAYGGK